MSDGERTLKLEISEVRRPTLKRPVLVILQGQALGLTIQLAKDRTVLGRGTQADIVLNDEVASRLHAQIDCLRTADDCVEYYIHDLDSTNGTYLNGTRIASQQLLQDGDKIKIGNHLIKFAMLDEFETEFQERLHQMTQRDELTGLLSRRSLFADLDRVISQAARTDEGVKVAVLMLDLDFFKRVNDGFGHLVGSHTIRDVGHLIRDCVGSADLAARYGGEEYFAYLFGDRQQGIELAETIRRRVEEHAFSASTLDPSRTLHITISIGIAAYPEDGMTALELVQRADQALYRAKLSGRNRTCAFDPEIDRPDSYHPPIDASAIISGPADAQ